MILKSDKPQDSHTNLCHGDRTTSQYTHGFGPHQSPTLVCTLWKGPIKGPVRKINLKNVYRGKHMKSARVQQLTLSERQKHTYVRTNACPCSFLLVPSSRSMKLLVLLLDRPTSSFSVLHKSLLRPPTNPGPLWGLSNEAPSATAARNSRNLLRKA